MNVAGRSVRLPPEVERGNHSLWQRATIFVRFVKLGVEPSQAPHRCSERVIGRQPEP
jgi:hypothetical protein